MNKARKAEPETEQEFLERMQDLLNALPEMPSLTPEQKITSQHIVEFCMGKRNDVPGIYSPQ